MSVDGCIIYGPNNENETAGWSWFKANLWFSVRFGVSGMQRDSNAVHPTFSLDDLQL